MDFSLKDLGKKCLIVASVQGKSDIVAQSRKASLWGADIIELRIDSFSREELEKIVPLIQKLKKKVRLPIIATVRSSKEQGPVKEFLKLPDSSRKKIYEKVMPHVDLIDVELSADKINRPLAQLAYLLRKKVIFSYHDFHSVPSAEKIYDLAKKSHSLGGTILKIAATPRNVKELTSFMLDCLDFGNFPRAFIAMGELGRVSRIIGFSFGSSLTYGYIQKTTAPGQISVKKLAEYGKILYF